MFVKFKFRKPPKFDIDSYICRTENGETVVLKWDKNRTVEESFPRENSDPLYEITYYGVRFAGGYPGNLSKLEISFVHGYLDGAERTIPAQGAELRVGEVAFFCKGWKEPIRARAVPDPDYLAKKWSRPATFTQTEIQNIIYDSCMDNLLEDIWPFDGVRFKVLDLFAVIVPYKTFKFGGRYVIYDSKADLLVFNAQYKTEHLRSSVIRQLLLIALQAIRDDNEEKEAILIGELVNWLNRRIHDFYLIKDIDTVKNFSPNAYLASELDLYLSPQHGDLFWLLSLKIDTILSWPLGRTMGSGMENIIAEILNED